MVASKATTGTAVMAKATSLETSSQSAGVGLPEAMIESNEARLRVQAAAAGTAEAVDLDNGQPARAGSAIIEVNGFRDRASHAAVVVGITSGSRLV